MKELKFTKEENLLKPKSKIRIKEVKIRSRRSENNIWKIFFFHLLIFKIQRLFRQSRRIRDSGYLSAPMRL